MYDTRRYQYTIILGSGKILKATPLMLYRVLVVMSGNTNNLSLFYMPVNKSYIQSVELAYRRQKLI